MKAEYLNPFLNSLATTFSTMLNCDVERGDLCLKSGRSPVHEVTGVIGLSGKVAGMVVLNLSKNVAVKAAETMLLTEFSDLNPDVLDVVGELTNMVAGAAKAQMEELELSIGLPTVVTGADHEVNFPSNVTPICVPYQTPWGPMVMEVGMAPSRVEV